MGKARKSRRKPDGSFEIPVECVCCGSRKCEVNSVSGKTHCWSCGSGGRVQVKPEDALSSFLSSKDGPRHQTLELAPGRLLTSSSASLEEKLDLTDDFPVFALRECVRRRQEPQWLIRRYGVRWSYTEGRLFFPACDGGVLRSVLSWEEPKTRCVTGPSGCKGLIGSRLLVPGARVVLSEGDFKSVSTPVPWIGIGLQGTNLTQYQKNILLCSSPASVCVMLDGGWEDQAQEIVEYLLPYKATRVSLPKGYGPDDIDRCDLVNLLLEHERK